MSHLFQTNISSQTIIINRIRKLTKPFVGRCFKSARKGVKRSRKIISRTFIKKSPSSAPNAETAEACENSEGPHIYATVTKHKNETKKLRRDSQKTSDSASSSSSDSSSDEQGTEEKGSGMISVELHAYETVGLESDRPTALGDVPLNNGVTFQRYSSNADDKFNNGIYDEVEGLEKTSRQ